MKDHNSQDVRPGYYLFGGEPSLVISRDGQLCVKTIRTIKPLTADVNELYIIEDGNGKYFSPAGLERLPNEVVKAVRAGNLKGLEEYFDSLNDAPNLEAYTKLFNENILEV